LTSVPASQASIERVFSAADFAADNRCRPYLNKMGKEVFIRMNDLTLLRALCSVIADRCARRTHDISFNDNPDDP